MFFLGVVLTAPVLSCVCGAGSWMKWGGGVTATRGAPEQSSCGRLAGVSGLDLNTAAKSLFLVIEDTGL